MRVRPTVLRWLPDWNYRPEAIPDPARPEPQTLTQYRYRHAMYRRDPFLRAAHANQPWAVVWDDHEVENNWAGIYRQNGTTDEAWLQRRAAAFQAYYEHMPLRLANLPIGPDMALYRRLEFGDLVSMNMLDTRQYRDPQVSCAGQPTSDGYCDAVLDPDRTILGGEQRRWLSDGLVGSAATWNVLAQQVIFAPTGQSDGTIAGGGDKWNGYAADRERLLDLFGTGNVSNPVVLTGDIHQHRVYDVPGSNTDLTARPVATEFVGTSVTSGGQLDNPTNRFDFPDNPHQRYLNNERGYVRCTVTHDNWIAENRVATDVRQADSPLLTRASWAVEAGRAGAQAV